MSPTNRRRLALPKPRVEVFQGALPLVFRTRANAQRWYFRRIARNGRIIDGEGYATASNARRAARRQFPALPVVTLRGA